MPKSCADPRAAIDFLNYAYSPEGRKLLLWGVEGADWEWNALATYPLLKRTFTQLSQESFADQMKMWGWLVHDGLENNIAVHSSGGETLPAREFITGIARVNPVLGMLRAPPDSSELAWMNKITDLFKSMSIDIICADSPDGAMQKYDDMLQIAAEMGADELERWAAPKYVDLMSKYEIIKNNKE